MAGGELNRMFDVGRMSDHFVLFNQMFCPRIHATSNWRNDRTDQGRDESRKSCSSLHCCHRRISKDVSKYGLFSLSVKLTILAAFIILRLLLRSECVRDGGRRLESDISRGLEIRWYVSYQYIWVHATNYFTNYLSMLHRSVVGRRGTSSSSDSILYDENEKSWTSK